jgi:hypothetical protein
MHLLGAEILSLATFDALTAIDVIAATRILCSFRNFFSNTTVHRKWSNTDLLKKVLMIG